MGQDDNVDLLVAGAGGGLIGALRAAERGLSVLVIEANRHFATSNNTAMSTAMIPGAGSRWQREAGIADSPARFRADVDAKTDGQAQDDVATALTEVSAELVEWLADFVGLDLSLVTDFQYPGHSRFRCHTVPGRSGRTMLTAVLSRVRQHQNIDIMTDAELIALQPSPGDLWQATIATPDGRDLVNSRAILLATGGFGADDQAVSRYVPEIADAVYHGSEWAKGTALRLGRELGGQTADMGAYQGHAALAMPAATLVGWATVMNGAVLVDRAGRRFGDESTGYSEFAAVVLERAEGEAWLLFDRRIYEASLGFQDFQDTVSSGALRWGADVAELARLTEIDERRLTDTVADIESFAAQHVQDPWGRTWWPAPLTGELAAVSVRPALFHTQGGLVIDRQARVLDGDGQPIRGLYASGGAAVGMSGSGAHGYLAGNGLLAAMGLAYLAATELSRSTPAGT